MAEVTTAPVKPRRGRPPMPRCEECGARGRKVDDAIVIEHESTCANGRKLANKRTPRKVTPALAAPGEVIDAPVRRERRAPAVSAARYTAQVVIMTEPEHAALARAWATKLKRVQADVLREIFEAGVRERGLEWAREYGNLSGRTLGQARREVQEMADARTERRRKFNAARPTRSD